jgi:hypothetical protein
MIWEIEVLNPKKRPKVRIRHKASRDAWTLALESSKLTVQI